tara:strand:+ start:34379 stop:35137 length:759 start_codon:yes stop_codon:yes gene_type:complete
MTNTKIEPIIKKPIYIFKIENFLDDNFYDNMKKNFPQIDEAIFLNKINKDGKFGITSDGVNKDLYKNFYNSNKFVKKFHDSIINKNFYVNILNKLYYEIIKSNLDDPIRAIKYLRPYKLTNKTNTNYNFLRSNFFANIEYSYIKNNGGIVPHTDSIKKIFTLMLYFPEGNNETSYGTSFLSSEKKNYSNTHVDDSKNLLNDKSTSVLYKTPFIKNTIFGFIRNNKSWHFVEKQDINENYIRKSININFILKN